MNKYDILPTESNLALSIKNDTTGRNSNLYNLLRLLNLQQESLSIAINDKFTLASISKVRSPPS